MEKVIVEVELPKEIHELSVGLSKFVGSVREALKDGFQMGQDIPPILTSALADLVPAIEGMDQVDDEFKEDPAGVIKAVSLSVSDIVGGFLKKDGE